MFKSNSLRPSLFVVLVLAVCFAGQAAQATTIVVGTCLPGIQFSTITAAVTAAPPGGTVKVCPGSYFEQFSITKKLTLEGVVSGNENAVVIYPPAAGLAQNTSDARGAVAAQILVQGTAGPVNISNLTVDGTGNNYTGGDLRGILYQDASGIVNHVAARNQIPGGTLSGDQSGQGIMVETTSSSSATLTVENSSVHNYNKNGIVARYSGASLTATGNYVQGAGAVSGIAAQNGIEIAFNGATGTIKNNTVIDNVYFDPTSASSSDILLYDAAENAKIAVSGNILGNSQVAISLFTDSPGTYGDGVSVTTNKIFGTSSYDAIDVCTNSNVVTGNVIFNTAQSGVHLDASCGGTGDNNTVSGNTVLESACAGYLIDSGTSGNGTPTGTFLTVPFEITSSTGSCTVPAEHARTGSKVRP
jgi:parallel beta-helix repeat protein